ncbi:MAG: molybdenum ABC transporter ATP-binding protein [Alphaproteobacteria bacterium]
MTLNAHFAGYLGNFTLDARFAFPAKGLTALFGPSGCGKTSVLRCIAGLNAMDFGLFDIGGETWQNRNMFLAPHKRSLGYVFQDANLFPHLSARGNLLYGAKRAGRSQKADAPAPSSVDFDNLVELLGIGHLLDRAPANLSGGERQRVAIGRALLAQPKILLMDEPLSALDHQNKSEIMPYLERLHDTLSIPVLYVTHALDEVTRLADHMVLMEKGRVMASGALADVLSRLDLPFQQDDASGVALDAMIVERDTRWHLALGDFGGGKLWFRDPGLPLGSKVRLRILASDVSLSSVRLNGASILNLLPAKVVEVAPGDHPAVVLARVNVGGTPMIARLTARSAETLSLAPGVETWVQIKTVTVLK